MALSGLNGVRTPQPGAFASRGLYSEPLSSSTVLAMAQNLSLHSSAPLSALLPPQDKAQYMPWPTEAAMRAGILFMMGGSMSGVGDLGKIGDGEFETQPITIFCPSRMEGHVEISVDASQKLWRLTRWISIRNRCNSGPRPCKKRIRGGTTRTLYSSSNSTPIPRRTTRSDLCGEESRHEEHCPAYRISPVERAGLGTAHIRESSGQLRAKGYCQPRISSIQPQPLQDA
jgi:hypothetical protein